MFFQLVMRDEKKFERWGCVSLERMPTREEVIAEIPAEQAFGEWVEWESELIVRGAPVVRYYAAFEHEVIGAPKVEMKRCAARRLKEVKAKTPRVLKQLRMEV